MDKREAPQPPKPLANSDVIKSLSFPERSHRRTGKLLADSLPTTCGNDQHGLQARLEDGRMHACSFGHCVMPSQG